MNASDNSVRRLKVTANVMKILDLLAVNQDKWLEGALFGEQLGMNYFTAVKILARMRETGWAVDRKIEANKTALTWQITREGLAVYRIYKEDQLFADPEAQRASIAAQRELKEAILAVGSDAAGIRFAAGKLAYAAERFPEVAGIQEALVAIAKRMTTTAALFETPPSWAIEYYDDATAEWQRIPKPFTDHASAIKYLIYSTKYEGKPYRVLRLEGVAYLEETGTFGAGPDQIE